MRPARLALAHTQPKPRTAAECIARLEGSRLYQRREMDARLSQDAARLAAIWYCEGLRESMRRAAK